MSVTDNVSPFHIDLLNFTWMIIICSLFSVFKQGIMLMYYQFLRTDVKSTVQGNNCLILTESEVFTGKTQIGTLPSCKDQMFKVNKLFIVWLFALVLQAVISLWAFWENNAQQLANQSAGYIGYKHELCTVSIT